MATTSVASGLSSTVIIGIGVAAGVVGAVIIGLLAFWKRRQGRTNQMSNGPHEDSIDDEESGRRNGRQSGMSLLDYTLPP